MALQEVDFAAFPATKKLENIAEASAEGKIVNFGWVRPEKRDAAQEKAHTRFLASMPQFSIRGRFTLAARRYPLWSYIVKNLGGKQPNWIWQQTGSCVGAGGGNMTIVSQGVEIALKNEPEEFKWPWWLFAYGRSRFLGGMRGRGEGSFGSAWKEAALTDGMFELDPAGEPDLPDPTIRSGWAVLSSNIEMEWSDGGKIAPNWLKVGKKHLFKTAAAMRSADDCIDALANGYALTQASMFGFSPMVPPIEGKGENAVRLVRRWNATWSHQTWIDEFWDNPDLGPIFHFGNNWGPQAHGEQPNGGPSTGPYITYELMDKICKHRDSEVYAFSGLDGFPARESQLRIEDFQPFR